MIDEGRLAFRLSLISARPTFRDFYSGVFSQQLLFDDLQGDPLIVAQRKHH